MSIAPCATCSAAGSPARCRGRSRCRERHRLCSVLRFTRAATSPPMPQSAMLMKKRTVPIVEFDPPGVDVAHLIRMAINRAAASISFGMPTALRKSPPVPPGRSASTASSPIGAPPASKNPLTTSLSVPSPPTTTIVRQPPASAVRTASGRVARLVWCGAPSKRHARRAQRVHASPASVAASDRRRLRGSGRRRRRRSRRGLRARGERARPVDVVGASRSTSAGIEFEPPLGTKSPGERQTHVASVEVAVEVEDVRLDRDRSPTECRPRPDAGRGGSPPVPGVEPARVDARRPGCTGPESTRRFAVGTPSPAPRPSPRSTVPSSTYGLPSIASAFGEAPRRERFTDPPRRHDRAAANRRGDARDRETLLPPEIAQDRNGAFTAAPEREAGADEQAAHPEAFHQRGGESRRAPRAELRGERQDDDTLDARTFEQPDPIGEAREHRRAPGRDRRCSADADRT